MKVASPLCKVVHNQLIIFLNVSQVEAQLEVELQKSKDGTPLNFRLAAGLAASYLPPLAPAVKVPPRPTRRKLELPKPPEPRKGPNRLSLK